MTCAFESYSSFRISCTFYFFFFFQAEDGIRDIGVTGVQTCALPISAVATPVLGRLGDTWGERPVALGVLAVMSAGTLLALVTSSLPLLLVARVLQGASYGLFPLAISVLRRELPAGRLDVAMSVVSSTLAVGGVVGLVAAGMLTRDGGDYHRPFWIGLVVCLVTLVLTAVVLPRRRATGSGRVDWAGAAVLAAGPVLPLPPVSQGHAWGGASPGTPDRKSVVQGKRVELGGRRVIKKK